MAKAELQADQAAYDGHMARARAAEAAGRHADAILHAMEAWPHLDGMMKFERRWEEREFQSVACIDLVLRYAPLLFHFESLETLASMLKSQKSIDRNATDDLADRVSAAMSQLLRAQRLWNHIEDNPETRQDEVRERLGGDQDEWRATAERWAEMGLIVRTKVGGRYQLELATNLDARVRGRCAECGRVVRGMKRDMLSEQACPACLKSSMFAILGEVPPAPTEV